MTRATTTTIVRAVVTAAIGALMTFAAASVLWIYPGSTVTTGPAFASAACVLVCTVGFLLLVRLNDRTARALVFQQVLLGIEVAVLGLVLLSWQVSGVYFTGWLATFGSVVLAVSGTWQLLGALVTTTIAPTSSRVLALHRRHTVSRCTTTAVTAVLGVGGLVATGSVHTWQLAIVSPLVVITSASLLFAVATTRILRAGDQEHEAATR